MLHRNKPGFLLAHFPLHSLGCPHIALSVWVSHWMTPRAGLWKQILHNTCWHFPNERRNEQQLGRETCKRGEAADCASWASPHQAQNSDKCWQPGQALMPAPIWAVSAPDRSVVKCWVLMMSSFPAFHYWVLTTWVASPPSLFQEGVWHTAVTPCGLPT